MHPQGPRTPAPESTRIVFRDGRSHLLFGGPFRRRPAGFFGVNMAAEIDSPCAHIRVPTTDFSTPDPDDLRVGLLAGALSMRADRRVYVGCMGGVGRTGLYLCAMHLLASYRPRFAVGRGYAWQTAMTARDARSCVRAEYDLHAVETDEQLAFLAALDLRGTAIALDALSGARS